MTFQRVLTSTLAPVIKSNVAKTAKRTQFAELVIRKKSWGRTSSKGYFLRYLTQSGWRIKATLQRCLKVRAYSMAWHSKRRAKSKDWWLSGSSERSSSTSLVYRESMPLMRHFAPKTSLGIMERQSASSLITILRTFTKAKSLSMSTIRILLMWPSG